MLDESSETTGCGIVTEPRGHVLYPGEASGEILILDEPLSFWGGVDHNTGAIVDVHHPQHGASVRDKILVMTSGKGSSSSSSVFAELVRRQISPAAVILVELDAILVLGSIVGNVLYGRRVPFVSIDHDDLGLLKNGRVAEVDPRGLSIENG